MFTGCGTALVTPFRQDLSLDEQALRRLVRRQIEGGVDFLVPCGTTGENPTLSRAEHLRVVEITLEEARGRLPVLAGCGGYNTAAVIELGNELAAMDVDGLLSVTPYYNKPTQEGLYQHYKAIAAAVPLPIVVYSVQGRTGVNVEPATVRRLAEIENIVGIKDSSGDLEQTAEYIRVSPPDFAVLMGRDTLILAGLLYGAKGAIAATANVAPALVVSIYKRFKAGDLEGARRAQEKLAPLRLAFSWGTFPVVIKEALDLIGMEGGPARAPVGPLSPEQRERLRNVLRDMGLV